MIHTPRRLAFRSVTFAVVATFAAVLVAPASPVWGAPGDGSDDPDLTQTVTEDEAAATGPATIDIGHVDVGPKMIDGKWTVQVRDDSGDQPVWRDPNETVLVVKDEALLAAPTDEAYSFMGAAEGEEWYVIPQTQNPDVVWLGWNTQDPGVTSMIDRGATMSIGPVRGPGKSWMFLQNGTFGEPLLLVDGQKNESQDVWVDVNTHVHANWVFTEAGVYTAALTFSADTLDGEHLTASTTLRFAVGSSTSTDEAFAAASPGSGDARSGADAEDSGEGAGEAGAQSGDEAGATGSSVAGEGAGTDTGTGASSDRIWWALGIVVIAALIGAVGASVYFSRRSAADRAAAIAHVHSGDAGLSAASSSGVAGDHGSAGEGKDRRNDSNGHGVVHQ